MKRLCFNENKVTLIVLPACLGIMPCIRALCGVSYIAATAASENVSRLLKGKQNQLQLNRQEALL